MSARLTRAALAAALAVPFAVPVAAGAQQAAPLPARPRLEATADTADWRAYYAYGVQHVARQPEDAERAFYWASRLNPVAAEPLLGRYVAGWRHEPELYRRRFEGERAAWESPVAQRIDSLYSMALGRDPLVNRQLTSLLDHMLVEKDGSNLEYDAGPMTQGMLAYSRGDYTNAVKFFGQALPTRAALAARDLRALSYYVMGDYPHAAEDLQAAIGMVHGVERRSLVAGGATAATLELALGNVYRKAGDAAGARAAYMRALGEDVSLAAAHVALADLALVAGDAATATLEYGAAADIQPNDGGIHARFGDALRVSGDLAGAAEQYRKAIELEPYYFVTYLNLGIVLDKLQQRAEATAAYTQFLARAPRAMAAQIAAVQRRLGAAPNDGGSR